MIGQLSIIFSRLLQGYVADHFSVEVSTVLMDKMNDLPGLDVTEDPQFHDDIQLLQEGAARKHMNLVAVSLWIISSAVGLVGVAAALFTVDWWVPFAAIAGIWPLASQQMKLYELGWSMTIQNTQEARELGYLQRVAMRHEYAKETRLYNLVPVLKADYASRAQRYNKTMRGVRNKQLIGVLPMNLLFLLSNAGIFIYAALQAGKGELSAGSLVLVVTSLTQLHQTLTATTEYLGLITEHLLWYKKYYDFLDAQPKVRPAPQPLPCPQRLDIFLENVTFGYSVQPPIFEGLNLTLPEGQIVAIVGENGAGKSSLVKLLLRFYDPTAGRILIGPDKIDLRQLDIQAWRSQFAAVFQDFSRFEWTISQNIVLAAPRDEQRLA